MTKKQSFRIEQDSLGDVKVPKKALWGAQTQRAIENFPISGIKFKLAELTAALVLPAASPSAPAATETSFVASSTSARASYVAV